MRSQYFDIEGFENIYLEDSFVLEIKSCFSVVDFLVEVILTENHPLYSRPKRNEQYCYHKAKISFPTATEIIWIEENLISHTDIDGEIDFGNIDSFIYDDEYYNLSGDWGKLKIKSAEPTINFIED